MPHFHNALHHFDPEQRAFRAALGETSAEFSGIERGGETVTPVLDMWNRFEFDVLRGKVRFGFGGLVVPAVAARYGIIEFINPAGSGLLMEIHRFATNSTSPFYTLDSGSSIAANPVTSRGQSMDSRYGGFAGSSKATIVTGDVAANTVSFPIEGGSSAVLFEPGITVVIAPGHKFVGLMQTANTAVTVTQVVWDERRAKGGEL